MKHPKLTRRNFLKLGMGSTGALALAAILGPAPVVAQSVDSAAPATVAAPSAGGPFYVAPGFKGIASSLSFGAPADLNMGWDGTVWSIDPTGAPHTYDHVNDVWLPHTEGIDAAAQVGDLLYFFKGDSFITASQQALLQISPIQTIASQWPTLPHLFTQNLVGAGNFDGRLLLFTSGQFTSADGSIPPKSLVTLRNWPFIGAWVDGVIDGVYCADVGSTVILIRGNEFIRMDPVAGSVTDQPAPLSSLNPFNPHMPPEWLTSGFDTGTVAGQYQIAFRGNAMVIYTGNTPAPSAPQYIPAFFTKGWPTTWHPLLIQAPSGRVGNLWAIDSANNILQHDGTGWNIMPGKVANVSVGQDGTVYHVSAVPNDIWRWDGTTWVHEASSTFSIAQISVGDADHMWVRDTNNQVYRYSSGTFTPVNLGSAPVHMAANADGTLWHCDGVAPHAFRHISEGTATSSQVVVGNGISSVHKVASTGFGLAFCLATGATVNQQGVQVAADIPQVYQYDSPYVFKTSASYGMANALENDIADIAIGPSCIFVADQNALPPAVVALDSQTGVEVWRQTMADFNRAHGLIYDPALQLVYCVAHSTQNRATAMLALDASTGQRRWTYQVSGDVAFWLPTLQGRYLCAGDTSGTVHLLDTVAALQNGQQNKAPIPLWNPLPQIPNMNTNADTPDTKAGPPTFATDTAPGAPQAIYITYQSALGNAPQNGQTITTALNIADGSTLWSQTKGGLVPDAEFSPILDSVVGQCIFSNNSPEPALIVNGNRGIWALRLVDNGATSRVLNVPQSGNVASYFSSGLTLSSNTLYVGDNYGILYVIDTSQLAITKQTTDNLGNTLNAVWARPVVVTDSQANTAVFFLRANRNLNMFDPASGNIETLGLDQNALNCIVYDANHGVLYGSSSVFLANQLNPASLGQAFGLRIAKYIQDERAFIIESQMMQDYDEPADGKSDPTPAARYQTHISLVDANNAPLPNVSVKVWADEAVTLSIDGGDPVLVDPNATDPSQQFVAFQTDGSGSFTIHSGSYKTDGSDAPDFTAVTLRLWAGFMDVHERIVVMPDAELHTRLSTTHATTQDPSNDHPNEINLQNASDYPTYKNGVEQPGTPLFTSDEQKNGTPSAAASSIHDAMSAIGGGNNTSFRRLRARRMGAAPDRYTVGGYTLSGMAHQATNTPTDRSVTPAKTLGFSLVNGSYLPMFHTDAATQIDQLGDSDTAIAGVMGLNGTLSPQFNLGKSLKKAWKDIKKAGAKVTHAIVSAAKDIYIGIRYVVNGIVNVVKAVVQDVDDVMAAIGSFFVQLGKDVLNAIRALSLFLHLKEIVTTYKVLRQVIDEGLSTLGADLKNAQSTIDSEFTNAEARIENKFCNLINTVEGTNTPCPAPTATRRAAIAGRVLTSRPALKGISPAKALGTPMNTMQGVGSTPHSVMTVSPVPVGGVSDDAGQSQAVQGMWGTHKLRQNSAKSTPTDGSASQAISDLMTGFYARLSGDLSGPWNNTKQQFLQTFHAKSASEFFADAIGDVLSLFEDVAVGAVAVVHALVGGIIGVADDMVAAMQNGGTIKIPVLSTLWKMVTGKPLEINLIDIFAFIMAIPTTIVYRILSGHWVSQDINAVDTTGGMQTAQRISNASFTIPPQILQNVMGIASAVGYIAGAVLSAVSDSLLIVKMAMNLPNLPLTGLFGKIVGIMLLISALIQKALGFYKQRTVAQTIMLALAISKAASSIVLAPVVQRLLNPASPAPPTLPYAGAAFVTTINFLASGVEYAYVDFFDKSKTIEFILIDIFQRVQDTLGPLKFVPADTLVPLIVPAADLLFLGASAALTILLTIKYWKEPYPTDAPGEFRYYAPWIAQNGRAP